MADDEEAAVLTVGVWEVFLANGTPYFYRNDGSETTQWECPEELKEDARVQALLVVEDGDGDEDEEELAASRGQSRGSVGEDGEEGELTPEGGTAAFGSGDADVGSPAAASGAAGEDEYGQGMDVDEDEDEENGGEWGEARDEETGKIYYFNRRDGTTTWDRPEGFVSKLAGPEDEEEEGQNLEEGELEEGEMDEDEDEEAAAAAAAAEEEVAAAEAGQGEWGEHARARWGGEGDVGAGEQAQGAEEGEEEQPRVMTTAEYEAQQYRARVEQLKRERESKKQQQLEQDGGEEGEGEQVARPAPSSPTVPFGESAAAAPMQPVSPQHPPAAPAPQPTSPAGPPSSGQQQQKTVSPPPSPSPDKDKGTVKAPEEEAAAPNPRAELERLRALLTAEDAMMEPSVSKDARAFIEEWDRLQKAGLLLPEDAKRKVDFALNDLLASGYRGFANMGLLVAGWLQGLTGDGTEPDLEAGELVLDHLKAQVRHNFDLDKADALLFGRRQDMAFIDEMMAHARWRRLLMEIFAEHRESKLLGGYCMQHMSRAGHNTEMADIISVEDYWSVARGVLTELMAEVPWADHVGLFKLLGNLKRICCSTAYLHAFSQEVLRRMEEALAQKAAALEEQGEEARQQSVIAAQRKYRRIREELEKASWEAAGPQDRGRSRFVHKLSAWQRDDPSADAPAGAASDPAAEERRRQLVETLMGAFCERGLSDRALETLQAFYVDERLFKEKPGGSKGAADAVFGGTGLSDDEEDEEAEDGDGGVIRVKGTLEFLRHPQLLDLLVRALFDPKTRLNTSERRAAAAKLLAVASTALLDGSVDRGEAEGLRGNLHEASDLLAEEATLHWNMATSATPAALKRLLERPVIAMGFLHWLRATIQDPEFHNSRQFNEVMGVFMRLLQYLVVARPLHQPAVFAALRALLLLKPTESSFQIIRMKRQALQCCVFLMSHGFVLPVLSFFHGVVKDLDHALVRHFVGLLLVVAKPPYSPVFARGLASLLREAVVSKALRSSDLDASHRRALVTFIEAVASASDEEAAAPAPAENGDAAAAWTPTKDEKEREKDGNMEVDGNGTGNGQQEGETHKGPPPLLDAAMRKGLRLVYAQFLPGANEEAGAAS